MNQYKPTLAQGLFGCQSQELKADWAGDALYDLSEYLGKNSPENQSHGLLGGEWGYGQDFDNDVFSMRPYYWGDCDCGYDSVSCNEEHRDCYQNEYAKIPEDKKNLGKRKNPR